MTRRLAILLTGLGMGALVLATPGAAWASSILYTNFGSGLSYNTALANTVGNDFIGDNLGQGDSFKTSVTSTVGDVLIALGDFFSSTNTSAITVSLDSNASGLPGGTLESWTIAPGTLGSVGNNNAPIDLTSVLHPTLTSGTLYWLTATTDTGDTIGWGLDTTGDPHNTATSIDGGATWFDSTSTGLTPGAFQVDGPTIVNTGVPEPGTLVLLGSGLALAARRSRQRKQAKRSNRT